MLTDTQKRTAWAIVNIFETGLPLGDYGMVTLLPGDSGHLTYGRSQTTLGSGNLALLLHDYCQSGGAFAAELVPWLDDVDRKDLSLDDSSEFRRLLHSAGDDPVMQHVQDIFFERVYWQPAVERAQRLNLQLALSTTVVYDGTVHGSVARICASTNKKLGTTGVSESVDEHAWTAAYVAERRAWLGSHSKPHPTQDGLPHGGARGPDRIERMGTWRFRFPSEAFG